ncbi:MAG TPA: hypothetical protein VK249_02640, partial [Anaerolineales bacterium]|nr:hypothetical protein [Anaerolineales bacterium]
KQQLLSLFFAAILASCNSLAGNPQVTSPSVSTTEVAESPKQTPSSGIEPTSTLSLPAHLFSSDQLGLCFSYPEGYTQLPYEDTVEIIGPDLPAPDLRALFWLEKSDAYDRTAEVIADQDMTAAAGLNVGRSFVTLDGEEAVVLDGMPGQDFQRRVYVVHDQTLYVLAFMPTRSENQAASDQLEALYTAVTSSWAWSPCSAKQ